MQYSVTLLNINREISLRKKNWYRYNENVHIQLEIKLYLSCSRWLKKGGQSVHPLAYFTLYAFTDYTLPYYPL